jgi:hypothetical protein
MNKERKILTLGDIHGRSIWKNILFGSPEDFESWADLDAESAANNYPVYEYDKVIFVGDYVDSFSISNVEMKKNLEDIILLKRNMPERVELLLGNHDISYIVEGQFCSGFRPEMKWDFRDIFETDRDLFKMAHIEKVHEEGDHPRTVLWTHAGVTTGWWDHMVIPLFENPRHKFAEILKEINGSRVDTVINHLWEMRSHILFTVDNYSGGDSPWAGPLWVRPGVLNNWNLAGYDQIVGHTPQHSVWYVDIPEDSDDSQEQDRIIYVDTFEYGDGTYHIINSKI